MLKDFRFCRGNFNISEGYFRSILGLFLDEFWSILEWFLGRFCGRVLGVRDDFRRVVVVLGV